MKDLCKDALPTELRQLWQHFKDLLSMNQSFGSFPRIPVLASAKALFKAKSALMAMCTGGSPVAFDPRTPRPSLQRSSHSNYLIQYFVHLEYLKCCASSLVPLGFYNETTQGLNLKLQLSYIEAGFCICYIFKTSAFSPGIYLCH